MDPCASTSDRRQTPPPGPPSTDGLRVDSISKRMGGRLVLDRATIHVRPGEVVALFGPDGAGKTVCFYAILGLIRPESGRILLDGIDVTRLPTYRRARLGLGYLPQDPCIFQGLTVSENIAAILDLSEPDFGEAERRLDALLAEFHLEKLRDRPATLLSGGERRRCEIARALASDPSIMLLDEPFGGLDPISIGDVAAGIATCRDRGVGVLLTDSAVRDSLRLIDRAYVLEGGRVIFEGSADRMVEDPEVRRCFLGDDPYPVAPAASAPGWSAVPGRRVA